MANKDLSQNIELNVSINPQSIAKAQSDIAKISMAQEIELNIKGLKAAGGKQNAAQAVADAIGVDIQSLIVGKFKRLTDDVEAKLNKASSDVAVEGMDLNGFKTPITLFAKKYNALVDSINESAKSFTQVSDIKMAKDFTFGIDEGLFDKLNSKNKKVSTAAAQEIDDFISIMEKIASGQTLKNKELLKIAEFDFARDGRQVSPKDSFTDKAGNRVEIPEVRADAITISPALLSAVADKIVRALGDGLAFDKPMAGSDIYEKTGDRSWKPKGIYTQPSAYQASSEEAGKFQADLMKRLKSGKLEALQASVLSRVADDFDEITEKLLNQAKELILGFGNIKSLIKDDPTWTANALAAEDAMAGALRYVTEGMQELLPNLEADKGYEPGTYLRHGKDIKSKVYGTTFDNLPSTGSEIIDPGFINKVLSEQFGEIDGQITNALPDAIETHITEPFLQIMRNPGILGKGFATQPSRQITKMLNADEKAGLKLSDLTDVNEKKATFVGSSSLKRNIEQEIEFTEMLIDANKRNAAITNNPEDRAAREKRIADLTTELDLLRQQVTVKQEAKTASPAAPAMSSGVREFNIEDITKYLKRQKEEVTAAGREFVIGFDNEFNKELPFKITEAALRIRDENGQIKKTFDMFHAPTPGQATNMAAGAYANNPKSIAELAKIAKKAEYANPLGSEDPLQNFLEVQSKIRNLTKILQAAADLDIPVVGNNIQGSEWSNSLVPVIKIINDIIKGNKNLSGDYKLISEKLAESGVALQTIHVPQPKLRDLEKIVKANPKSEQAQLLKSGNIDLGAGSTKLGNMLKNAVDQFGDLLGKEVVDAIKFTKDGNFTVAGNPSHTAGADAEASVYLHDLFVNLDQLSGAIENTTKTVKTAEINRVNAAAGDGIRPPAQPPVGGGFAARAESAEPSAARLALRYKELDQLTRSLTEAEAKLVTVAHDRQSTTAAHVETMRTAVDASRGLVSTDELLFGAESKLQTVSLERIRQLSSYSTAIDHSKDASAEAKAAVAALAKIEELAKNGEVKRADVIGELRTIQKAYNLAMYDSVQAAKKSEIAVRDEIKAEQRKGDVKDKNLQTLSKQIDAELDLRYTTEGAGKAIVDVYKDQVQAEKEVQAATKASINQWVTGRYALYDLGNAYQNVSRQMFMAARQIFDITKAYRSYETAFTSVERAMQLDFGQNLNSADAILRNISAANAAGAQELKDEFIALSEQIPVAFEELSRIATLGAQMGIGAKGITQFTETVAQFAAVTGISADTVAQKFGKIAELADIDSTQFANLGSAVTFAGVNAVATESEILTLSESIAAVSNQVGITAPEIVGLGTALSSVGIPAEQARGVFTRVFADIDRVVATGGKSLDNFAAISGMSGQEFAKSWGTEGKSYEVFRSMLGGLNSAGNLTKAFDALNIRETREINTLTRLANNLGVVDRAIMDAVASFGAGDFLAASFNKTVDNLDSQIVIFQNNIKSLTEEISQGFGDTLKNGLAVASEFVKILKEMSKTPAIQFLSGMSFGLTAIVGVMTGMTAIIAKVVAQIYAFRVAMINSANDNGAIGTMGKQLRQLTNFGSGLVEMRDKLLSPNADVRGEIVPVDYGNVAGIKSALPFANAEKVKRDALMKTQNVFLASNREQADSLQKLILLRNHEIDGIIQNEGVSRTFNAQSQAAEKARLAQKVLYVEFVGNEAKALTKNQYAEIKAAAASEKAAGIKNGEAAARLKNIQAMNAETRTAVGLSSSVVGIGQKIMGFTAGALGAVTILTTIWSIIDGIRIAVQEANKIDLAGSGLTVEALKETIKQDTQAWMDNGKAIATQASAYATTEVEANKYAVAVSALDENLKKTYASQKDLAEVTRSQTVAFGDATKELIINSIIANEKIKALIDKNANMFNDLAAAGFNASDMIDAIMGDPADAQKYLDGITNKVNSLKGELEAVNNRIFANTNGNIYTGPQQDLIDRNALQSNIKEIEALGLVGSDAFKQIQTAIEAAKIVETMKGYSAEFVGFEGKLKNVVKTGKGMTAFLKTLAQTVITTASITDQDLILKVNSAKSVDEMLRYVKAAHETIIAQKMVAAGNMVEIQTSGLEGSIRSLQLLSDAAASAGAELNGKGAETAAEKLKRLISEANSAKSAVFGLNGALRTLGASLKDTASWSQNTEKGAAKLASVLGVVEQIGNNAGKNFPKAIRELQVFQIVMSDMGAPKSATDLIANAIKKLGGDSTLSAKQIAALRKQFPQLFSSMLAQIKAGAMPFKTLTTYIGEIRNALQSAFDFRYGKQTALDNLNKSWITLKEAATSAADAIKKANEEIAQTTADRTILEYQLGIAEKYNDQRRAASIRAKLAANSTQKAEQEKALADAKDAGSTVLTGDTKAAIDNRAKIRDLVTTYNSYLISLANTGMSAEDLKKEATKLSAEFLAQGKALGFAEKDLQSYTDAFKNDFTTVINGLPTNITLKVDTDPALRAISEFVAEANAALAGLNFTGVQVAQPSAAEIKAYKSAKAVIADKKATAAKKKTATAQKKAFESKYGTGYAAGGFVSGSGGAKTDSIPAMLSNGEYVVQASSVKAYGVDFLNALNQQRVGFQPVQPSTGGQQQQSGPQMVYLSPEDRALLRSAVDRPVNLYTENQKIASSANAGNVILAQRGAR